MRVDEISKAAAYSEPAPKNTTAAEMLLFLLLGALYKDFKKGYIDKQAAAEKKALIVSMCQGYENAYNEWCTVYKNYQDSIKKAHDLIAKIEKSKDVAEIADNSCEVISIFTGDESFAKRQRKKWEE